MTTWTPAAGAPPAPARQPDADPDPYPGPDHFQRLGREGGLGTALAAVLDGLDLPAVAPHGVAALAAADVPPDAQTSRSQLADLEGISVVRLAGPGPFRGAGLSGLRAAALAAVRVGLLERMLGLAVERLSNRTFANTPLIDQQLITGSVADIVTELDVLTLALIGVDAATPVAVTAEHHDRLSELGWQVTQFFGAEGYIADHPVRALYVSALVADIWTARPGQHPQHSTGQEERS